MRVPKWILLLIVVAIIGQEVRWYTHDCPEQGTFVNRAYVIDGDEVREIIIAGVWTGGWRPFGAEEYYSAPNLYADRTLAEAEICRRLDAQAEELRKKREGLCD